MKIILFLLITLTSSYRILTNELAEDNKEVETSNLQLYKIKVEREQIENGIED